MEPKVFRSLLYRIVSKALPLTAGTMLMAGCQSIHIIGAPDGKALADAGTHISTEKNPNPDGKSPDATQFKRTTECAVTCRSGKVNNLELVEFLKSDAPDPLSYEKCKEICRTRLRELCPSGGNGERSTQVDLQIKSCEEKRSTEGQRAIFCGYDMEKACIVAGRRPSGLQNLESPHEIPLHQVIASKLSEREQAGAFFAELAYLEEAAVTAFAYLSMELEHYEAPEELVKLAQKGIKEEVEHAELIGMLSEMYGGIPKKVEVEPFRLRPLVEIAEDNAREGCARETFGALLAMWQAKHAEEEAVRRVMERISYEESIHGALSWKIDEWIQSKLTPEEQERCQQAHRDALAIIKEELQQEQSPALIRYAGFPNRQQSELLYQELEKELWG